MSNGLDTYVILRYFHDFPYGTVAGYESKNCNWDQFGSNSWTETSVLESNTGLIAQYIFKVNERKCMTEGELLVDLSSFILR